MNQEPTHLPYGVNFLGFLSQQLGDLSGITTLAHEFIQNADDAKDEKGSLSATRICFDFRDDALEVSNDASFRDSDFKRISDVASGSKRSEAGDRTTGTFGIGFVSAYQITDRPEIHSAGRILIFKPDNSEIDQRLNSSTTSEVGTLFRLPWAFEETRVRRELRAKTVDPRSIEEFVEELIQSLPKAILFLKKLETIELLRNGIAVCNLKRDDDGDHIMVNFEDNAQLWRVFEGDFATEGSRLKATFPSIIDSNRSDKVRVAIPDPIIDDGLLFATLPTERSTRLPFHIDADFFPASDRKSIAFGAALDPRFSWNRAAIGAAAAVIRDNLLELRDFFANDPSSFWTILDRLQEIHKENQSDTRMPLNAFWDGLIPLLRDYPIVFTASGNWLKPIETRVPTSEKEQNSVSAFDSLGIEMVHRALWRYRNTLTGNAVGVGRLAVEDIWDALNNRGLVGSPQDRPSDLQTQEIWEQLWQGVSGVLESTPGQHAKSEAEKLLRECTIAPGVDGRIWPCGATYKSNEHIREIFGALLPSNLTFLAEVGVPLLEQLCPSFTPAVAIELLEYLPSEKLQASWNSGDLDPAELLHWFDDNKAELNEDMYKRLTSLPVFPSARKLCPLKDLWLPGGFEDPMGVAELLDMSTLGGLSDFLRTLGAEELTFTDYAMRYIAKAFADNSVSLETKHNHLSNLELRIGEIRDNRELRNRLSKTDIVECLDGVYRQPVEVYFPWDEVTTILGDYVSYADLPNQSETRRDLYEWLGVEGHPRIDHILQIIDKQTTTPPSRGASSSVSKMLEALGKAWTNLGDDLRERCSYLQNKEWLPAEGDAVRWYRPSQLDASFNRELFESQGRFINASRRVQEATSDFMRYLGVRLSPRPVQVVKHLLRCSELDVEPPNGVYSWLNNNAEPGDLEALKDTACLRIAGKYLRPDQVFWGKHPFGRYRIQLGADFRTFQKLLQIIGIKEEPRHGDAFAVLEDVSRAVGNSPLNEEDYSVVIQCWIILSEALQGEVVSGENIRDVLVDLPCVPNKEWMLYRPSWMFFEDRPGLTDRFPIVKANCIPRMERVWTAMEASGVRPLSEVLKASMDKPVNPWVDEEIRERVRQRGGLIRTILDATLSRGQLRRDPTPLDEIRFIVAEKLLVKWRLQDQTFGLKWDFTEPEPEQAYFNVEETALYFTIRQLDIPYPWSAIARELTQAIAPGEETASISPGLKTILEASTYQEAQAQLVDLGIASVQELPNDQSIGDVADSFDVKPSSEFSYENTPEMDGGGLSRDALEGAPPEQDLSADQDEGEESFAKQFYASQTADPSSAPENPVMFPGGGPKTEQSARMHTSRSSQLGRREAHVPRIVTSSELGPEGKALEDEFRSMVHGDYGKRCQICSRTFKKSDGEPQVFVVHVVEPRKDHRTNHFGDLLGLCGWHYALIRYGEWALIDPENDGAFEESNGSEGWERMRAYISGAEQLTDEQNNPYICLPVRFSNVYQEWRSDPETIRETIRYSIPHWKYLCELLWA